MINFNLPSDTRKTKEELIETNCLVSFKLWQLSRHTSKLLETLNTLYPRQYTKENQNIHFLEARSSQLEAFSTNLLQQKSSQSGDTMPSMIRIQTDV